MKTTSKLLTTLLVGVVVGYVVAGCSGAVGAGAGDSASPASQPAATTPANPWHVVKLNLNSTQPEAGGPTLNRVFFLADGRTGWIVGEQGLCLATRDGGASWQTIKTGSGANLRAAYFVDAKTGWLLGDSDPGAPPARGHVVLGTDRPKTAGTLLSTVDGGATWKTRWMQTNFELPAIATLDGKSMQIGHSGGAGHLDGDRIISRDGGLNWSAERAYRALLDVRALDARHWLAVGSRVSVGFMPTPDDPLYTHPAARAIFSTDGGTTWNVSQGSDGPRGRLLRGLTTCPDQPIVAVGDNGAILLSEDFGTSWKGPQRGVDGDLRAAAWGAKSPGESPLVVAVGKAGLIAISLDSGKNWRIVPSGVAATLNSVAAVDGGFIIVGESGVALRADRRCLAAANH